jgi:hypothetical protein
MNITEDKLLEWYYCVVSIDYDFGKQLGMRFDRIVGLRESMEKFFVENQVKPKE